MGLHTAVSLSLAVPRLGSPCPCPCRSLCRFVSWEGFLHCLLCPVAFTQGNYLEIHLCGLVIHLEGPFRRARPARQGQRWGFMGPAGSSLASADQEWVVWF